MACAWIGVPGEYSSCEQMTMSENMKALLVIDVQKTYISKYEANIVQKINERIIEAQKNQYDIVYIKNTKKLRSGMVTDEYGEFFLNAPQLNPNRKMITGKICGIRVEEIEEPLMQEICYLDKLVDELAKGKR